MLTEEGTIRRRLTSSFFGGKEEPEPDFQEKFVSETTKTAADENSKVWRSRVHVIVADKTTVLISNSKIAFQPCIHFVLTKFPF